MVREAQWGKMKWPFGAKVNLGRSKPKLAQEAAKIRTLENFPKVVDGAPARMPRLASHHRALARGWLTLP